MQESELELQIDLASAMFPAVKTEVIIEKKQTINTVLRKKGIGFENILAKIKKEQCDQE